MPLLPSPRSFQDLKSSSKESRALSVLNAYSVHISSLYELTKLYLLDVDSIETMLLAAPQLVTLSCFGHGRFIRASDDNNTDRLPPIKKLALTSVSWKSTAQGSDNLWNWTQITHLELRYMGVDNFLKDVSLQHLVQLWTLLVIGFPSHLEADRTEIRRTIKICNLIRKVHVLKTLVLRSKILNIGHLSAILKHGPSLRFLGIRDRYSS